MSENEFNNRPTRKIIIPELDEHPLHLEMIKKQALAKLTAEEKKVLGIDNDNL